MTANHKGGVLKLPVKAGETQLSLLTDQFSIYKVGAIQKERSISLVKAILTRILW